MKKIIIFALSLLVLAASCGKKSEKPLSASIQGEIMAPVVNIVYLEDRVAQRYVVIDSALVTDGRFLMTPSLSHARRLYLRADTGGPRIPYFLENSPMEMRLNFNTPDSSFLRGSHAQDSWVAFQSGLTDANVNYTRIAEQHGRAILAKNVALMDSLEAQLRIAAYDEKNFILRWLGENFTDITAVFVADRYAYLLELPELQAFYSKLSSDLQNSEYGSVLSDHMNSLALVQVGQIAPEISLPDPGGNTVNLSDLRGNYVLVDFWASWCKPCRNENPNVVKLYRRHKKQNFEILGVSLDRDSQAWLDAMKEDDLRWIHVSDLQGWNSSVVKPFAIRAIPHTLLLDPEGRIIARNLRGDALKEKLAEIFPK